MARKRRHINDAHECEDRIMSILSEYRCYIEYDPELNICIVVDHDSSEFADGLDAFTKRMKRLK